MSYSIIFETKIVKLDNGDIIHFDLSGCNNDNCGRDRGDFTGKLYTAEAWEKEVSKWEGRDGYEDSLKIGKRWCSWADYGKHLRRMTNRALTFDEFTKPRLFVGYAFDGITYDPEDGTEPVDYPYNAKECDDLFYDVMYGHKPGYIRRRTHNVYTQEEVRTALENKQPVQFYIGHCHRHVA